MTGRGRIFWIAAIGMKGEKVTSFRPGGEKAKRVLVIVVRLLVIGAGQRRSGMDLAAVFGHGPI